MQFKIITRNTFDLWGEDFCAENNIGPGVRYMTFTQCWTDDITKADLKYMDAEVVSDFDWFPTIVDVPNVPERPAFTTTEPALGNPKYQAWRDAFKAHRDSIRENLAAMKILSIGECEFPEVA